MKTEEEIKEKLKVVQEELKMWRNSKGSKVVPSCLARAQESVNALEWVLGEYDEW